MANDGSVVISVKLDAGEAEAQLAKIKKKIIELETQLAAQQNVKTGLEQDLQKAAAAAEEAKKQLRELEQERARMGAANFANRGTYSQTQMSEISAKIEAQKATVAELEKAYKAASAAVDKQNAKIAETNANLEAQRSIYGNIQQQAAELGRKSRQSGSETAEGMNEAGDATSALASRLDKVITRITNLAKRVFFFTVITRALRAFRDYVSSALKTSDEFNAAMARLKGALATAFQPIFTAALPAIIALINVVTQAVQVIASLVSLLFGSTFAASNKAAEGLYNESKALDKVAGSAGKAAKQFASFDEINQLGDSGGGEGISASAPNFDNVLLDKIKEFLDGIDFTRLQESISGLKESFGGLVDTIKRGLSWCWENILQPLAKWTIEEAAPRLIDLLAAAFDVLNVALEKLGEIFEPVWETLLKPFFKMLGNIALGGIEALTGFLKDLAEAISNFDVSAEGFGKFIEDVFGAAGEAIGNFGTNSAAAIGGFIDELDKYTEADLSKIKKTVLFEINYMAFRIEGFAIKTGWIIKDVFKLFSDLVHGDGEAAKADLETLAHDVNVNVADEAYKMAKAVTEDMMSGKESTQNLGQAFKDLCIDARNEFPTAEDAVDDFANGVSNSVEETLTPLQRFWDKLVGILETLQKLSGISVTGGGLLGLISGNGWSFDLKKSLGINIPHLASGAVIPPNREFLSVLGDQTSGTNIEAPLDTIVAAFRQALNESGGGQRQLVLKVGERDFASMVFDVYNAESGRVGVSMVR